MNEATTTLTRAALACLALAAALMRLFDVHIPRDRGHDSTLMTGSIPL